MNPENNIQMSEPVTTEPQVSTPHPVHQITPLSKYLAMGLFVLLPFVGGYVGYTYAINNNSQVAPVLEVNNKVEHESIVSEQNSQNDNLDNESKIVFQKLNDVISSSDYYAIKDNQIICKSSPNSPAVPYSDQAFVSNDIDYNYLIVESTLYWKCTEIGSINRDSLKLINNNSSNIQDNTSIFFSGTKIEGADVSTFSPAIFTGPNRNKSTIAYMTNYYADANHVYFIPTYYTIKVIAEAKPSSFETLEGGPTAYAKDENAVYYQGSVIKVGSVKDFEVVESIGLDGTAFYIDGKKIADGLSKASVKIYQENEFGEVGGGSTNMLVLDSVRNNWYRIESKVTGEAILTSTPITNPSQNSIGLQIYPY